MQWKRERQKSSGKSCGRGRNSNLISEARAWRLLLSIIRENPTCMTWQSRHVTCLIKCNICLIKCNILISFFLFLPRWMSRVYAIKSIYPNVSNILLFFISSVVIACSRCGRELSFKNSTHAAKKRPREGSSDSIGPWFEARHAIFAHRFQVSDLFVLIYFHKFFFYCNVNTQSNVEHFWIRREN